MGLPPLALSGRLILEVGKLGPGAGDLRGCGLLSSLLFPSPQPCPSDRGCAGMLSHGDLLGGGEAGLSRACG